MPRGTVHLGAPTCPGVLFVPRGSLHPGALQALGRSLYSGVLHALGCPCTLGTPVGPSTHRSQAAPPSPCAWGWEPHPHHGPHLTQPQGKCFTVGWAMGSIGIVRGTIKRDAMPTPRQSSAPEGAWAGWGTWDPSDHHVPLVGVDAWSCSAAKGPFTAA